MITRAGVLFLVFLSCYSCSPDSMPALFGIITKYAEEAEVYDKGRGEITRQGQIVYEGDESSPIFGASLSVPADAVGEDESVDVEIIYQPEMELPDEPDAQIILYKPKDYTFNKPVSIGLPYGHLSDVKTEELVIVRFDPETKEKYPLPTTDVSENTEIVYTETKTLGYFAISEHGVEIQEFTDERDGQTYTKVTIGDQVWMAENLNYESQSSKLYNNEASNADVYGRLYNWDEAQTVCPNGWHLPSDLDWKELEEFLGMNPDNLDKEWDRGEGIGGMLKESGTSHWQSPNEGAINSVKFSARAGGMGETSSSFIELGQSAYFWTATSVASEEVWYRVLYYADSYIGRLSIDKNVLMSVRCLAD